MTKFLQLMLDTNYDVSRTQLLWEKQNAKFLGSLEAKLKSELLHLLKKTLFELEARKIESHQYKEAYDLQGDLISASKINASLDDKKARRDSKKKAEYFENMVDREREYRIKHERILAGGRKDGTQANQSKAQKNTSDLKEALEALFNHGQGFQMSHKEIANFLMKRNQSYKYNTLMQKLKTFVPIMREKYKSGL